MDLPAAFGLFAFLCNFIPGLGLDQKKHVESQTWKKAGNPSMEAIFQNSKGINKQMYDRLSGISLAFLVGALFGWQCHIHKPLPSRSLTARPWKIMVGRRLLPFRMVYFQGRTVKLPGGKPKMVFSWCKTCHLHITSMASGQVLVPPWPPSCHAFYPVPTSGRRPHRRVRVRISRSLEMVTGIDTSLVYCSFWFDVWCRGWFWKLYFH